MYIFFRISTFCTWFNPLLLCTCVVQIRWRQIEPFVWRQMLKMIWSSTPKVRFVSIKFVGHHLPAVHWDCQPDDGVNNALPWPKNANNFRQMVHFCAVTERGWQRYSDATLTLLWRYSDATLTLLWRYSDATLTLLWRYSDATLTLLWRYSDAILTLLWHF
jgi:hypothetical protein